VAKIIGMIFNFNNFKSQYYKKEEKLQ